MIASIGRRLPIADFVNGLAAGCVFVTVELASRVAFGVKTLPELIQDRLVQNLPGPVFAYMLTHLLYLGKPSLFAALLLAQVALGGVAGVIVLRWRQPAAVAAVLWLATGLLLWPLTTHGVFASSVAVALTAAAAFAAYTLALLNFESARLRPASAGADPLLVAGRPVSRRQLLGGVVFFVAAAGLARAAIGHLPKLPSKTATGLPEPITPVGDFYLVSKNIIDPSVNAAGWKLHVDGLTNQTLDLTYDDILAMEPVEDVRTMECISNEVGGDLISTGNFTGVRMADVLNKAGVKPGAALLHFTSQDGYTENMVLDKAMDPSTLLVYKLNGEPLPVKHGYPLRVLGTGTYGMKNPKWLTHIELVATGDEGFWEHQGWNPDAIIQTMSRIDVPPTDSVPAGDVALAGIAFAGDRGISGVEVSTDNGKTWQPATLQPPQGPLTWVFWNHDATLAPATYDMLVRATDGKGTLQTSAKNDTYPAGATGWQRIEIDVV